MFVVSESNAATSSTAATVLVVPSRLGLAKAKGLAALLTTVTIFGAACGATATETSPHASTGSPGHTALVHDSDLVEGRSAPLPSVPGLDEKLLAGKTPTSSTVPPVVDIDRFAPRQPGGGGGGRPGGFSANTGPHRLAPAGGAIGLLRWDNESARRPTHVDPFLGDVEGPFTQIADAGSWGVVFQRPGDDTIWRDVGLGPVALITSDDPDITLLLEGVVMESADDGAVYYRSRLDDGPGGSRPDTLRSYELGTGIDNEIEVVAGYETVTNFNLIHEPEVVSSASGEGYRWSKLYTLPGVSQTEWFSCIGTVAETCPRYDAIAYTSIPWISSPVYAMVKDDPSASATNYRLVGINPETGDSYTIHTFAWEQGLWDIEDFFVDPGGFVVISVMDGDGNPLPPAAMDFESGEVWTLPEAAFVRPVRLS